MTAPAGTLLAHPLRLGPGVDLRAAIEAAVAEARGGAAASAAASEGGSAGGSAMPLSASGAAFVLQAIGSLSVAQLRYAGRPSATTLHGDLEILTLAGSVAPDGAHLHMSVADAQGRVFGGHVAPGCMVRTTAEVLLALLPGHVFSRETDAASGYKELVVRPLAAP